MARKQRLRLVFATLVLIGGYAFTYLQNDDAPTLSQLSSEQSEKSTQALEVLEQLPVKGKAPKTGYSRAQFGNGWTSTRGCDTRNIILARDLDDIATDSCRVTKGTLNDPYTGKYIQFQRGASTSDDVQIDHVVALSNAWQTGAQQLTPERRIEFANDPLNLLAVDGAANQQKGDGDAATWLPANKPFRCQYVTRQLEIKRKYTLWIVEAEKAVIQRILASC